VRAGLALLIVLTAAAMDGSVVHAIPLQALDSGKEWRVGKIAFSGNQVISQTDLRNEISTKERPWYRFWAPRPEFDPVTFEADLERMRRLYEARGYYQAAIKHDLEIDDADSLISIEIMIEEGPPIVISAVDVDVVGPADEGKLPAMPESLPVKRGDVFNEAEYQRTEQELRDLFARNGYAYIESERRAEIHLDDHAAHLAYTLNPGPLSFFGPTRILDSGGVDPVLIERELTYRAGEIFSSEKVAESRAKILGLDLFSSVKIAPELASGKPSAVPMLVEAAGKPHREIRLGVGYSTEEEFRVQFGWRHLNWLGGGRQLSAQLKYSSVSSGGLLELVQPHFLTANTKGVASLTYEQQTEDTFKRNFTRFGPRIDHQFSRRLTGFIGFRVEYNNVFDINAATEAALGKIRKEGIVSGPALGLVWNTSDSPFDPKRGEILSLTVEQAGAIWGGQYRFYKITTEAKKYYEIGWSTVLASRVKLGLADAIGSDDRYPIFERFYAGGEKSVRGYGRRRLGPLSDNDDPLGGLTLLEGSLELRRPIWQELGGALFLDFGQVAQRSFDFKKVVNLDFSAGFGLSYNTPVGPVRLDIGFPFEPPRGDRAWQVHFSIGAFF
jgi:outer membrane protein assembly complex protein YaeT